MLPQMIEARVGALIFVSSRRFSGNYFLHLIFVIVTLSVGCKMFLWNFPVHDNFV